MKVLIVDDHPLVRGGLSTALSIDENIEEIQEASNVEEALRMLSNSRQDIAIVDLMLGMEDGLEIVDKAKKMGTKTKFIILTSSIRKEDFTRACESDVDGYILKDAFAEDIIYALHVVARGRKYYYPQIMQYQNKNQEYP